MIPKELQDILRSEEEVLGGTVCFRGTRIPVRILFEHVNHGSTLQEFLAGFPSVSEQTALRVLAWEEKAALNLLESA